jgi:hypothetical protein
MSFVSARTMNLNEGQGLLEGRCSACNKLLRASFL